MVDEDAGQLVSDRLVDEQRGDRRVDAARQPAEHALRADLRADPLHLLVDDRGRVPRGVGPGHAEEEVLEHRLTVRRVDDLGVELHAVQAALAGFERGHRRRRRPRGDPRALGRRRDRVAMAHPADLLLGEPREELAAVDAQRRLPELRDVRPLDGASQLLRHQLRPVTDAERRHAELEKPGVDEWRVVGVDRGRPAGEDERRRIALSDVARRDFVADELGVHATLAHAPGDELRVLTAEIEDEDRPRAHVRR